MRVAVVAGPQVPIPPKQYGGTEQVIYYLIRGLMEAGHEPILLGPADSTIDCKIVPVVDTALSFPKKNKDRAAFDKTLHQAMLRTERELIKLAPNVDIIHSHGYDLKDFSRFPNLTTLHCKIELENIPYYLKRSKLNYVSISKNQQETFPNLNYVGVVYNGEDPADFPIVTTPEDYVCFLGRFDRDKNPHLAIELAISLGIKIKLAGKIDFLGEGYFEEEVQKYLDHPLVEYLGELGFEDKVELLSKARCNLHPCGFREPFGLTVLEAAYCGTPTLAVRRGAMPEIIEEGRSGVLVEDFVEGYHHIEECFALDRTYVAARARRLFNYQVMTQHYVETYERVLESHKFKKTLKLKPTGLYPRSLDQLELLWGSKRAFKK